MAQCKAQTARGGPCVREIAPPSRSLCTRHQNQLSRGERVVNAETGRAFPRRK